MAIVQRIKGICLKPKEEWQSSPPRAARTSDLFKNYALPLAAIGAVAGFIGMSSSASTIPMLGTIRTPLVSGLVGGIVRLVLSLVGVYVLALIIDALAPNSAARRTPRRPSRSL